MADEIISALGFSVTDALAALQRLDQALSTSGAAFTTFGASIGAFNGQAAAALTTLREMATAAAKLSKASQSMAAPTPAAAAAAAPTSQLWLPPGVQSQIQGVNTALTNTAQIAATVPGQIAPIGAATQVANTHAKGLMISWQTIARVVMTQAIVRSLSMMRDALKEAVSSATEFQVRLAEIQTVTPRIGANATSFGTATPFKQLEMEVTEFSKRANIPLPQVEEGLYQTISDQFTTISDRTNVMEAAMKLAKVGVMDFGTAVTLLTGTLNAYGMQSGQAESVAAKFFETIRLGHVRGKELAEVMGQVIPIASELGVSLDEVNAAMVAMTIGGMDAHKSATALRGTMVALLKPSEELKKVLREMGFTDPSQLVAAKGYQGALQAISDAAGGMGSQIAKSVRNVRALTAELRLTSEEGAKKYTEAMTAMGKITPDALNKIVGEFRSTDADKLMTQLNALKVNLVQDFGQAMVGALATMMEMAGGADKVTATLMAFATVAALAAAAAVAVAAGFALMAVSLTPVTVALVLIGTLLAATAGASTYFSSIDTANTRKAGEARRQEALAEMRLADQRIAKWKEVQEAEARKAQSSWVDDAAAIRRDYFKVLDELKTRNQDAVQSAKNVMDSMVAAQDKVVSAYRNAANANVKAVQDSQNRVQSIEAQYSDRRFKYAQTGAFANVTPETQVENYLLRTRKLADEAKAAMATASTPAQIQAALAMFQRADAAAQEAASIAQSTGNTNLLEDAQLAVLRVMQQQIAAEKELQALQAKAAQDNAAQAALEQTRVNEMKTLQQSILKDMQAFEKGGAKDPKQLLEQEGRLRESVAKFMDLAATGQKVDVSTLLGFDQLQRRVETAIEAGVSKVQIDRFQATPEVFANLRKDIEQGIGPIRLLIQKATALDPKLVDEIKGMSAEEASTHIEKRVSEARQTQIKFGETEKNLIQAETNRKNLADKMEAEVKAWLAQQQKAVDQSGAGKESVWDQPDTARQRAWGTAIQNAGQVFQKQALAYLEKGSGVTDKDFRYLQDAADLATAMAKPTQGMKDEMEQVLKNALMVKEQAEKVRATKEIVRQTQVPAIEAGQRVTDIDAAVKAAKELQDAEKQAPSAIQAPTSAYKEGRIQQILDEARTVKAAIDKLQGMPTEAGKPSQLDAQLKRLQELEAEYNRLQGMQDAAVQGAQTTFNAVGTIDQISMANLVGQINSATDAMWQLVSAANAASAASAAASAASAASADSVASGVDFGGGGGGGGGEWASDVAYAARGGPMRYLASGGPSGTDTIPAMLSPGEFVMNASSTQRFYSQLVAMNAGHAPIYRASGGEVASVNVGDININGASQPRETAREVVKSIKREFRRGTSRW